MSVQQWMFLIREKVLPRRENPDLFWTGILTALLAVLNLMMIFYFLFSDTLLK
jgi:hypothetical protein